MASIRQRNGKWQVQIRRSCQSPLSRTFRLRKDALAWAREMERRADRRELPEDPKVLEGITLGDLVRRYRDTISVRKRGHEKERYILDAFLRHSICLKRLSELSPADFSAYREQRLNEIKPVTLKRQLAPIHNLFEIAKDEWALPIRDNPLDKVRLPNGAARRETRLRKGELERLLAVAQTRR